MTKSIYFPSEQPKHTLIHKIRTLLSMGESGGMRVFVCVGGGGGRSRSRRPFSHGKLQVAIGALKYRYGPSEKQLNPLAHKLLLEVGWHGLL